MQGHFKRILLRTPLLPLNYFFRLNSREELRAIFDTNPAVQEAIFLASPLLHSELIKLFSGNKVDKDGESKIYRSLFKYTARMSTRSTPFGLFALNSMGVVSDTPNIDVRLAEDLRRYIRLDMEYFNHLVNSFSKNEAVIAKLTYRPNDTIYHLGDQIRYIEPQRDKGFNTFKISNIDSSEPIKEILKISDGGKTYSDLVGEVISWGFPKPEAESFIRQLIEYKILLSEMAPDPMRNDNFESFLFKLKGLGLEGLSGKINLLDKISQFMDHASKMPRAMDSDDYRALQQTFDALETSYDLGKTFQVDGFRNVLSNQLPQKVITQVLEALKFMQRFSFQNKNMALENFKKTFYERYEDQEIPLSTVLDTETGLGYDNQLSNSVVEYVDGLFFPGEESSYEVKWSLTQRYLLNKYIQAQRDKHYEVELDENELGIPSIPGNIAVPDTYSCVISLLGECSKDQNNLIFIKAIGGPSALNLLGRFCFMDDTLFELGNEIASFEKQNNKDYVLAEISHFPDYRIGNILIRPNFREYEIPYLNPASSSGAKRILACDIMVSVQADRVLLRSKSLNKWIIPKLSNAHNHSMSTIPAYKFLCDLQAQDSIEGFSVNWGILSNEFKFLPRLKYKNIIFQKAAWNLISSDYESLINANGNGLLAEMGKWRDKWQMPEVVSLVDGDSELSFDLTKQFHIEQFIHVIRSKTFIQLTEFLFNRPTPVKDDAGNSFSNEFIISMFDEKTTLGFESNVKYDQIHAKRRFSPGEGWVYFKIYCGLKISDRILVDIISALVNQFLKEDQIDNWFFIRFADPHEHLRVRFHVTKPENERIIVEALNLQLKKYVESKAVWRIQLDTYNRELERYGYDTIEATESLFRCDSEFMISLLRGISSLNDKEHLRFLIGVRNIDALIEDFGFDRTQKMEVINIFKVQLENEMRMNKALKKQVNKLYRKDYDDMEGILNNSDKYKNINKLFFERSKTYSQVLKGALKNKQGQEVYKYLGAISHMSTNRLFKSKHAVYEFLIYQYLYLFYTSKFARAKKENANPVPY